MSEGFSEKPSVKKFLTIASCAAVLLQSCYKKDSDIAEKMRPIDSSTDDEITEQGLSDLANTIKDSLTYKETNIQGVYDSDAYARKIVMDKLGIQKGDPYRDKLDAAGELMVDTLAELIREKNKIEKNQPLPENALIPELNFTVLQ